MHKSVHLFCEAIRRRFPDHFTRKNVLDVGSLDINGNNRYLFENCKYTGIDICNGPNVDIVQDILNFLKGETEVFDTIISTEMLEHDKDYIRSIHRMFELLKPGGLLLITAAGHGRKEHGTTATSPKDSPLTNDYYKNIEPTDFTDAMEMKNFTIWQISYQPHDIRFFGIKKIADFGFEISDLPAVSPAFKSEIVHPKSEI